jgi:hypothetical protein
MGKQKDITLLFPPKGSAYQYSLYPLLFSRSVSRIRFTQNHRWVLHKDKNEILILFGWFKYRKDHKNEQWLSRLRDKYRVLVYFDENDSSDILYLDTLRYFDLYYKKQVFADRSLYLRQFYGNRIYAQYYADLYNLKEDNAPPSYPVIQDISETEKIRVAWNIAIGKYPLSRETVFLYHLLYLAGGSAGLRIMQQGFPNRPAPEKPSIPKCHARFGYGPYRYTVGYQRRLFLEIAKDSDVFLSGLVPKKQYNQEIKNIQAVLSPFGWGEICYRDIESVLNGAVLIKPDMSHLETWPDLFRENETYVPVQWDGSDLVEKAEALLADASWMDRLRITAWNTLKDAYRICGTRADEMIQEISDLR